jgi:hypothetical protein
MNAKSQLRDPFANLGKRGTFSAWAMAIAFATVAVVSFAVDQTVSLSSSAQEESAPSLLNPVDFLKALIDTGSK